MSPSEPVSTSTSFQLITDALGEYAKQTGIDLSKHPFAEKIQFFKSPDDFLRLLRERENAFKEYRDRNRTLINCLTPAVKVIHAFSATLGEAVSLVPFAPAKVIFVGIDVLISAASGVSSSYDAVLDLFECLGNFLSRLEIYTQVPPTPIMTDIIIKIIVELLRVLGLATKQIQQGRFKKFAKKLFGDSEVEAVLQRLDRLTQNEARMTIAQTFGMVHGLVNNTRVVMEDSKTSTDNIRQGLRGQLQRDIQYWLSPPDPSTNHDFVWNLHHDGTGAWLFESDILTEWKATGSLLWVYGKPGSGKSTLLSAIIEDIEEIRAAGMATMAYYYFDFREVKKQNRQGLLSSLLCQLSAQLDSYQDILAKLYSDSANGARKPTSSALTKCIKDMLSLPGQGQIYIVVDALDECPNVSGTPSAREDVLDLIEELVDLKLPNIHICVASRPEIDIRAVLEPLTSLQVSVHDEMGQKEDIINYVKSIVYSDRRMRKWKKADQELAIDILSKRAGGMFRWVVCQIDRLRRNFPASIRSVLDDLPKTLDETYAQTLLGIDEENRKYAQRLLQCLTVSIRPLRLEELAEIFAFHFDKPENPTFNTDLRPEDAEEAVLSACSSLIAIVNVGGFIVVQFTHFSVKEYLTSERLAEAEERLSYYHIFPETAHTILAHASLSVLLQLDDKIDRDSISRFPLAIYAARHWVDHAQFGNVSSHVKRIMEGLFDPAKPYFAAWVWLHDIDRPWVEAMPVAYPTQRSAGPLYYASFCGFRGLVEHLFVTQSPDINARGGSHTTALHVAVAKGHLEVASLLVENGADPNSCDHLGRTPLHKVSHGRQPAVTGSVLKITRLLLNSGARVDVPDDQGWTALHTAARNGQRDVAELLHMSGASLNARNWEQEIPLVLACRYGKLEVSRLLIDQGSDLNCRGVDKMALLHYASRYGHVDVARLLLDRGADVTIYAEESWSALHLASCFGYLDIVRLLLDRGACVDVYNEDRWTPLHHASRYGNLDIAQLLLGSGADVNVHKADGWTPLHLASRNGHLDIVKLLIQHGAMVDSRNDQLETPLEQASQAGCLDIVRFLIENGAAVSSRDTLGWTPFHKASNSGHLHMLQFLLDCGIDVDIQNGNEETALYLASGAGKLDIVRFLIKKGANIHVRNNEGSNPLHITSKNGHLDVVRLLIDSGTPIDIRNGTQSTPLALASMNGELEVSHFLIDQGADINARSNNGWVPLHGASRYGYPQVTKLLLDHGVDPDVRNGQQWTPLHLASANGHLKVARLLLQHGATVDVFNDEQETPLDLAASIGNIEIVRLLIDHGANLDTTNSKGWTPLHSAAHSGHLEVVKWLVMRGVNVEVVNEANMTAAELALSENNGEITRFLTEFKAGANVGMNVYSTTLETGNDRAYIDKANASLLSASKMGHLDVVKSALEQGADINAKGAFHRTPLDLAATEGNLAVVRLLIDHGAEVDSVDERGWTPLHKASRFGHLEVSQVLIDHSANVNARKDDHWTPIHLSAGNGHLEVVELLLERGVYVHALSEDGLTPYQLSLEGGSRKIADLLRKHGGGS